MKLFLVELSEKNATHLSDFYQSIVLYKSNEIIQNWKISNLSLVPDINIDRK